MKTKGLTSSSLPLCLSRSGLIRTTSGSGLLLPGFGPFCALIGSAEKLLIGTPELEVSSPVSADVFNEAAAAAALCVINDQLTQQCGALISLVSGVLSRSPDDL